MCLSSPLSLVTVTHLTSTFVNNLIALHVFVLKQHVPFKGFPGGADGKEPAC